MKRMILGLLFILAGCGSGGDSSTPAATQHVPGVSSLAYSPKTAALNSGGGAITISGTFNFIDAAGDINEMTITIQDADTFSVLASTHSPIASSNQTSGIITFAVNAGTAARRNYLFNVHVNDTAGNHSNPLTGTFSVN